MGAVSKLEGLLADETKNSIDSELLSRVSGNSYSMRHSVLSCVASGNYETALREIDALENIHKDFDALISRSRRILAHIRELIEAIKLKRSFPNLRTMPLAKQEEMQDRIVEHFEYLKEAIKKIEKIEADIRVQDVKSTLWVIRALAVSGFSIVLWALILEAYRTMGKPTDVVIQDLTNVIFSLFGI